MGLISSQNKILMKFESDPKPQIAIDLNYCVLDYVIRKFNDTTRLLLFYSRELYPSLGPGVK